MTQLNTLDISQDTVEVLKLMEYVITGYRVRDLTGLSEDHIEGTYTLAYNLYNAGKYENAEKLFRFLCMMDHNEKRFWMGLGASRKMLKKYAPAVEAYTMAALLDSDDPNAPLQAADCQIAEGRLADAKMSLQVCIELSGKGEGYDKVREHAKGILALIESKEKSEAAK